MDPRKLLVVVVVAASMLPIQGAVGQSDEGSSSSIYAVKTGRAVQWDGVKTDRYVGWTQINPNNPRKFNAWVQPHGGKRTRANWKRAKGAMGDIHANRVALVQRRRGEQDIKIFNVKRGRRFDPKGVNSRFWEYGPSLWKNRLLFARTKVRRNGDVMRIVLWANVKKGKPRSMMRTEDPGLLVPGQIAGDWAVWTSCRGESCFVVREHIKSGQRNSLRGQLTYFPAVLADGTWFYVRSGAECGEDVEFVRRLPDGRTDVLFTAEDGFDIAAPKAKPMPEGHVAITFTRVRCSDGHGDIYGWDYDPETDPPGDGSSDEAGSMSSGTRSFSSSAKTSDPTSKVGNLAGYGPGGGP